MSAVLRDLWPDDIQSQDVVSPEEILNHQAQQLEARTNGVLIAHVEKVSSDDRIVLGFEVEAPRLASRIRLFSAQHRLEFEYPVQILPPDGKLPEYLREKLFRPGKISLGAALQGFRAGQVGFATMFESEPGTWIENEWLATSPAQFTAKIEAVLNQPVVKAAVLSLLARANRHDTPEAKMEAPPT